MGFQGSALCDADAAVPADAAEIVALQVDQHHVLGALLGMADQLAHARGIVVAGHICLDIIPALDAEGCRAREMIVPGRLVKVGAVHDLRLNRRRRARAVIAAAPDAVSARLATTPLATHAVVTAESDGASLSADVDDVDAFVKLLAGLPLVDLVIVEPQLEELVLDLYRDEEDRDGERS